MPSLKTKQLIKSLSNYNKTKKNINSGKTHKTKFRSLELFKNTKTQKIGEGGFGIVSRPPARCGKFFSNTSKNINQRNINSVLFKETYFENPNYISKLTEYNEANKEIIAADIIKNNIKNWRNYYCFIEFICQAPSDKHIQIGSDEYQDTYAIAPYCGVTLYNILSKKTIIKTSEACCLIDSLKQLIYGIGDLHNINIFHQDIHDENILYNTEDKKLRLIDFGLTLDLNDEYENNSNINLPIINAKLMDTEGLLFDIIKPILLFVKTKIKSSKYHTKYKKCLDEIEYALKIMPEKAYDYEYPSRKTFKKYTEFITNLKNKYVDFVAIFIKDFDEKKLCSL